MSASCTTVLPKSDDKRRYDNHLQILAESLTILYDNMKTVVLSREGNRIHWNPQFMDFASHYGFMPKLCLPGRKETKGKVERPFSYIRSSFFRGTQFSNLADVNEKGWNLCFGYRVARSLAGQCGKHKNSWDNTGSSL
jgi:hypothetical protein